MTAKEIFLETIKKDGKPERLLKQRDLDFILPIRHPLISGEIATVVWSQ